jgi:hypothetical protein
MAAPSVDLKYRGSDVTSGLKLRDIGPTTAFIEMPDPLPVGTAIDLVSSAGTGAARVIRVSEGASGKSELPTGMVVKLESASREMGLWWFNLRQIGDPIIPEPVGGPARERMPDASPFATSPTEAELEALREPEPAPESESEANPEPDARSTEVMDAVIPPEAAEIVEPKSSTRKTIMMTAVPTTPPERDDARSTQIMTAQEIQAALAERAAKAAAPEEPAPLEDDDKTKGKKKRGRRRRR